MFRHAYDQVDPARIWEIATRDLPQVEAAAEWRAPESKSNPSNGVEASSAAWPRAPGRSLAPRGGWPPCAGRGGAPARRAQSRPLSGWLSNGSPSSIRWRAWRSSVAAEAASGGAGCTPRSMPVVSAPRLRLWPPRALRRRSRRRSRAPARCARRYPDRPPPGRHVDRRRVAPPRVAPDAAEQRAGGDAGGVTPAPQRAHRAELGGAVRKGDRDALAVAVAFRERQGDAQPVRAGFEIAAGSGQLGAAERAGEAEQQQRAVAQPRGRRRSAARISRNMPTAAASFAGNSPRLAARSSPANVSPTTAVVVGKAQPAR